MFEKEIIDKTIPGFDFSSVHASGYRDPSAYETIVYRVFNCALTLREFESYRPTPPLLDLER